MRLDSEDVFLKSDAVISQTFFCSIASSFCLMKPNLGISFSLLNTVTGAFVGPKTKINPFLQVVCHSCVNLTLLINMFDSVCACVDI